MQLFLDSADLNEVRIAAKWGVLSGVTTNPSLLAKAGARQFKTVLKEICQLVPGGAISAEVTSTDTKGMLAQACELAAIDPQIVVKIPITAAGLAALTKLKQEGIRTNVTLVFSSAQAILASAAGADFLSLFVGRLDDLGQEGLRVLGEIMTAVNNSDCTTKVIAASIRSPQHVVGAVLAGAHIVTTPFTILRQLFKHPLTDQGLKRFQADWEQLHKGPISQ